jgi:glycosidase
MAFIYQGDEIGMTNGPGHHPPYDRAGRDPLRHPMQWDASENGGFTTGTPWLPSTDPGDRNVEAQRGDPESLLHHFRRLIDERRELGGPFRLLEPSEDSVDFARGERLIHIPVTRKPG